MLAERFGDFYLFFSKQVNQLQRVYRGFSNVVVVANHEGILRMLCDVFDALGPRVEFFLGVKIVVALEAGNFRVVGEPRVVPAAVQPEIADWGSGSLCRL